jgi:hypothetical protein
VQLDRVQTQSEVLTESSLARNSEAASKTGLLQFRAECWEELSSSPWNKTVRASFEMMRRCGNEFQVGKWRWSPGCAQGCSDRTEWGVVSIRQRVRKLVSTDSGRCMCQLRGVFELRYSRLGCVVIRGAARSVVWSLFVWLR